MRKILFIIMLMSFLSYGQEKTNIQIVVEGVSYDIGPFPPKLNEIKTIHIKGDVTDLKDFGNGVILASDNANIIFPESTSIYDSKIIHSRNIKGESRVTIPGYWTTTDAYGYADSPGFTYINRELVSMQVEQDTVHVLSKVALIPKPVEPVGPIYNGRNAADPENEVNGTANVNQGDFLAKSVLRSGNYWLEFARTKVGGVAIAEIPMIGVKGGETYNISLTVDRFLSPNIDVRITDWEWDRAEIITSQGIIKFTGAKAGIDNAVITIQSTGPVGSGVRINDIVVTK